VASETDAARDRVIAARADLAEELQVMEASARAAVDIPARIKRSPAKAAAIAGGAGFMVLKGPQRLFGAVRRAVRGPAAEMPKSMLPDALEKTLRKMGTDGDAVRGALERDFADYAKQSAKERAGVRRSLIMSVAGPLLARGAKTAAERLLTPDPDGFGARLAEVRERVEREVDKRTQTGDKPAADDDATTAGA
jgi:hypothetical protein